jgi:hypothetical protein
MTRGNLAVVKATAPCLATLEAAQAFDGLDSGLETSTPPNLGTSCPANAIQCTPGLHSHQNAGAARRRQVSLAHLAGAEPKFDDPAKQTDLQRHQRIERGMPLPSSRSTHMHTQTTVTKASQWYSFCYHSYEGLYQTEVSDLI